MPVLATPGWRPALVVAHRYVGLVIAAFLVLAGLTGAALAWYHELDSAINAPMMKTAPPSAGARPLEPLLLRERVLQAFPGHEVNRVVLKAQPGQTADFWLSKTGGEVAGPNQVFVDPYTGAITGMRRWGDLSEGWTNLMPFIYRLHQQLALGTVGTWIFGIVALLWTLDCVVGALLCLPSTAGRGGWRSWWSRWIAAWQVRWGGGSYKLPFDLHRAGGLWLWAMLFVLAWSSVSLNLSSVYRPVMGALFEHQDRSSPSAPAPKDRPVMDWSTAVSTGERLMREVAASEGFTVRSPDRLMHDRERRLYRYVALTDRDVADRWGSTSVYFDDATGELAGSFIPSGKASGDTVDSWLVALHMAALWGLPFQLFVTLTGIAVAGLSATGVYLWWRKSVGRASRRHAHRQQIPLSTSMHP